MKVFFTSYDGEVWVNKTHLKGIIKRKSQTIYDGSSIQRFADILIGYLDTLYYKEEPGDVKLPADSESDYFYCGSCRRGFPVKYTSEMVKSDIRPCPTCGAQSNVTPKLAAATNSNKKSAGKKPNEKKHNSKSKGFGI